jgi:hypothetical protein
MNPTSLSVTLMAVSVEEGKAPATLTAARRDRKGFSFSRIVCC